MGQLKIPKLILLSLIKPLTSRVNNGAGVFYPRKVGNFKMVKKINKAKDFKMFSFAIYEDDKGKKAIAKIWTGKVKDFYYYTILNEAKVYKVLNSLTKRLRRRIPAESEDIKIPGLLMEKQGKGYFLILLEYVEDGRKLRSADHNCLKVYLKARKYLSFLGDRLSKDEKKLISQRSTRSIILLYPLLLLRALTLRPYLYRPLLLSIPAVFFTLRAILKRKKLLLSHRDLHLKNIIATRKYFYLIDLQFCLYTDEVYDFLSSLRILYDEPEFRKMLVRQIYKKYAKDKDAMIALKGMIIIGAVHGVCGDNLPEVVEKDAEKFLKQVTSFYYQDIKLNFLF